MAEYKDIIEEKKKVLMSLMNDKHYVPMKFKELAVILNVKKEDRKLLDFVLSELVNEGKITISKRGKYSLPKETYVKGIFISNEKGFGFVEVEGEEEDYFIPEKNIGGAFHHDTVLVAVEPFSTGKRKEGKVIKVLSHEISEVVGYFQKNKSFGYVLPDNNRISSDIYIPGKYTMGAVQGHKVVVKITDYGSKDRKPEGKVIEILGHVNDPGVDILSIVKGYNIPCEYPKEVMEQIENIPEEVQEKDKEDRLDIRDWQTVTIDGEDAKDLDDAITLKKEDGIYTLGVHIADVSHYVVENSPLDKEAKERGTSVYLVDRVIPMLPHKLSNGICSLNQGVDRLALSCIMKINENGEVIDHQVAETVVNVDRRMTYTAVNEIITNKNPDTMNEYSELVPMFQLMAELSSIIREKRYGRGAIDFDFPECKITLDEKGYPVSIKPYDRNAATKIIEDFMLMANETIAEYYFWQQIPFVYRNHEKPDSDRMKQLSLFITNFGYHVKMSKDEVHPKELQKLLKSIEGTPEEAMISRVTLRSMKRAEYTPECLGHFGLAAKYYCHFTSPIRRYPDLFIHRIISKYLENDFNVSEDFKEKYSVLAHDVASCSSEREKEATKVEREAEKLKKAEFMESHIGEEFEGIVSSVTSFGMFVELESTVEGLVRFCDMGNEYFEYDENNKILIGENTGKTYKVGDRVNIKVKNASKELRQIDFELF